MSHSSLSALPISCCTFTFVVCTKVDAVASSWLHGWSAVTGLPQCEISLKLEKDEADVAYDMGWRVRGVEKPYFSPGLAIHL